MPVFKTLEKARKYGIKNYFEPKIKKNISDNFIVYDEWDLRNKPKKVKVR